MRLKNIKTRSNKKDAAYAASETVKEPMLLSKYNRAAGELEG